MEHKVRAPGYLLNYYVPGHYSHIFNIHDDLHRCGALHGRLLSILKVDKYFLSFTPNFLYFFSLSLSLRIPIPTTLYKPCFKKKRLFVYIFPVIFFSIVLNIFKFLEADIEWLEDRARLNITQLRVDSFYILVNGWVR